jgi:DNA repair exonuclease SbcCD nuclease subunit
MKPTLKILHTADLHLGAKFIGLGAKGAEQRRRLRETLADIVTLAGQEKADLVLLAGDTFDSNTPSRESLDAFRSGLDRLSSLHIPVLTIGGTHDCLSNNSILAKLEAESEGRLVLLKPGAPIWRHPSGGLTVQGVSQETANQPLRPVSGLYRLPDEGWHVGMAHASLAMGQEPGREASISMAEIGATGLDYLGLGHWHGCRDYSQGQTVCWFAGAPEMTAMDEEDGGSVLLVSLEEGLRPVVTPHRVGKRSLLKLSLPAGSAESLLADVRSQADPERVLELTLTGLMTPEAKPGLSELRKALQNDFFHVRIRDVSVAELSEDEMKNYPETTIIGRFIRLVLAEKAQNPGQKQELEQVLQLGLALLLGREVEL